MLGASPATPVIVVRMENPLCREMVARWRQSGCFEAGRAVDAEDAVRGDDVFYTEGKPGRRPAGLRALWLEGPAYHGTPTRVFAWVGVPEGAARSLPAMVLLHGGGGTAFGEWVRQWVKRGYAAIAVDLCGNVPRGPEYGRWTRHAQGGPPGCGGFGQVAEALEDQWPFHAVAAGITAHSFIRNIPEVDPSRVGLTGISWGGYVTLLTAAADGRFRFAAPVYACGFYGERLTLGARGEAADPRWLKSWDPSHYLPSVRTPMLWLTGTNDTFFPLALWQRSHELPRGERTLCLKVRYPHCHVDGWRPKEIDAFADAHCRNGKPLCSLAAPAIHGGHVQMPWSSAKEAVLCYTEDEQVRIASTWKMRRVAMDAANRLDVAIPKGARWLFVNRIDGRDLTTSSPMVQAESEP